MCDTSRSTPRCINIVPLDGTCDDLNVCLTGGDDASLICLLGKCQLRPNKLILQENNDDDKKKKKNKKDDDDDKKKKKKCKKGKKKRNGDCKKD